MHSNSDEDDSDAASIVTIPFSGLITDEERREALRKHLENPHPVYHLPPSLLKRRHVGQERQEKASKASQGADDEMRNHDQTLDHDHDQTSSPQVTSVGLIRDGGRMRSARLAGKRKEMPSRAEDRSRTG
jgi:hypothetical protein